MRQAAHFFDPGVHELRVKWDIGTKGKDNWPVNHVLNLSGPPCVKMKSNRDISLHPKFREWMAQLTHSQVSTEPLPYTPLHNFGAQLLQCAHVNFEALMCWTEILAN